MSTPTVPSVTATIEQLKKDGLEFYLNSRLEPTVRIPNDAFQKEWPVDSQRVQDLLVAVHYDISEGGILRSLERDFLLAQLREECRNGGRRFSEFEGVETDRDAIVQAVLCHINKNQMFEGRTVDLLQRLRKIQVEGAITFTEEIPVFTNIFSRRLSRLIPVLKGYGIEVTLDHEEDGSHCTLKRLPEFKVEPQLGQPRTDGSPAESSGQSSVASGKQGSELQQTDDSDGDIRVDAPNAKAGLAPHKASATTAANTGSKGGAQ